MYQPTKMAKGKGNLTRPSAGLAYCPCVHVVRENLNKIEHDQRSEKNRFLRFRQCYRNGLIFLFTVDCRVAVCRYCGRRCMVTIIIPALSLAKQPDVSGVARYAFTQVTSTP